MRRFNIRRLFSIGTPGTALPTILWSFFIL
jgi:hypothetical protein